MRSKNVTMKDIAKAAGVSQSTVSMILNHKYDSFPTSTIDRVMSTATAMNYSCRHTASATNNTVMVVCVQTTNPYYSAMLQGIDRMAIPQGINVLTACSYHDPACEAAYLQTAIDHHFLGVIFLYPPDNDEIYKHASSRIPIVTICDKADRIPGDIVELNNFEAGVQAAKHLLSLGHRHIAVLTHASDHANTSRANRVAGILSEVRKVVSEDHLLLLTSSNNSTGFLDEQSFHYRIGYSLAQNKKLYQGDISGLICVNDLLAYGVIDALEEKGFHIPRDFSIIGSDNLLFSGMSRVSLTSIELHPDMIAQSALTTLLARTHMSVSSQPISPSARFYVQCMPNLVIRDSTAPARNSPLT